MKDMAAFLLLVAAMSAQNTLGTNTGRHLDIPAIAREANGSVVSIVVSDKHGRPFAQGSGFLISKDGHVVTNYHVIKNGSSAVIKLPDGAFFAVEGVLASDKDRDVAIIKAHGNDFRMLTLGDSDRLQVGEEVVAIGSPLSLESTVSNGIVSGIRTVEKKRGKFLQITVPISPGSSGGPLFNMAGEVVGITTSHLRGGENLNFAIPINDVKPMFLPGISKADSLPYEAKPVTAGQPPVVAPGQLTINSTPEGAQVLVDGRNDPSWVTPFNFTGLAPGQHTVSISRPGYAPQNRTIDVASGSKSFLVVQLAQLAAAVSVASEPAGAAVFIDGKDTGRVTPAQISVEKSGSHTLLVRKQGYLEETTTVNLQAGQAFHFAPTLRALGTTDDIRMGGKFKKMMGTVSVKTQPKGAQIAVNRRVLDKPSPAEFYLNPGTYVIDITMSGYNTIRRVINVDKGGKVAMEETMERE